MTSLQIPSAARSSKMRSIEAARAFAAISVMLMHAANLMRVEHFSGHVGMGNVFDFGYVGVDFFFVLSGFIITYVHFSEIGRPGQIPKYLWRRFSRIYPIYWSVLLMAIAIKALGTMALGKGAAFDIAWDDVAGTVFLLMGSGEPKYIGVAWSLQFEVVFYIAFCLLLIDLRIGTIAFCAWGGIAAASALGIVDVDIPFGLGDAHCLQFLTGIVVAVIARRFRLHASPKALVVSIAVLVAAIAFEVYGPYGRHAPAGRAVLGFASAIILLTLVGIENAGTLKTPHWLSRLGAVSYSIYLGHVIFINLVYSVMLKLGVYHAIPEAAVYAIAVCSALTLTALVGYAIELPLVDALKNRWNPQVREATADATAT